MRLLIGSIAWLTVVVLAFRWALPRLDESQKEMDHEEAIGLNEEWDREGYPAGLPAVPPILNQAERWQNNARVAEGNDDTWDGAA